MELTTHGDREVTTVFGNVKFLCVLEILKFNFCSKRNLKDFQRKKENSQSFKITENFLN